MRTLNRLIRTALALLALAGAAALAQNTKPFTATPTENDPIAAAREYNLARELRCLVCQNQTIADSNASLALDLRRQIREQIAAGRSDSDIIAFMTDRYGDFVLYRPPVKATTVLLWLGPLVLLGAGGAIVWRVVRTRRRMPVDAPLSAEDEAQAAHLLAGNPTRESSR